MQWNEMKKGKKPTFPSTIRNFTPFIISDGWFDFEMDFTAAVPHKYHASTQNVMHEVAGAMLGTLRANNGQFLFYPS